MYGVLVTAKASKLDIIILVLALKCYKMVTSYDLTDVFISTMRISRIDECEIAHSCFPLLDHFIPKYIAIHMNSGRLKKLDVKAYTFPPLRQWQSQFSAIFSNDLRLFHPISVKLSSYNLGFLI